MGQKGERLQKILARGGIASRRHAEWLITAGRVRVNGRVVTELGTRADPRQDKVEVDGKRVVAESFVYILLHKPRGVVATMSDTEGRPTVGTYLRGVDARIVPVGRLDFATSGALLMTNDGDFSFALLHPKTNVPKRYVVKVAGKMEERDFGRWQKGIRLEDGVTKPAEVSLVRYEKGDNDSQEKTWIDVTLREGRNQQIRRMGEATGFPVMRLSRTHFAGIDTEGLRPGAWRYLTKAELIELKKAFGFPKHVPAGVPREFVPPKRGKTSGVDARGRATEGAWAEARREAPRKTGPGRAGPARDGRARGSDDPTPRYGMGAPGRRGPDVRDDYGGTSGRGSTGSRDRARPGSSSAPGRGARTRTTGTGGGAGASEGNFRMDRGRHGKR
ncbi:hypothetical protein BH09MYX1_BH09MYX1_49890 [soil metagenome]